MYVCMYLCMHYVYIYSIFLFVVYSIKRYLHYSLCVRDIRQPNLVQQVIPYLT